jgi:hypothetical protein
MIYEFDATNRKAQSITRNTVTVSLYSEEEAIIAREDLVGLGFECTRIYEENESAFDTAKEAVEWTKRLLR